MIDRRLCAAALLLLSRPASAEIARIRITYVAPPICTGAEAFTAAVRADTSNLHLADPGEAARTLAVEVIAEEGGLRGRLRIEELDGTSAIREVEGRGCKEVLSALALVTALSIDGGPQAPIEAPTTPIPAPSIPEPAPPKPPSPPPRERRPAPRPVEPAPPPTTTPGVTRWQIGAEGTLFGGLAPNVAWGIAFFVDRGAWEKSGLAPSIRLALVLAQTPAAEIGGGTARFDLTAARLVACPVAAAWERLTLRPCAGLDAGALHGEGGGVTKPLRETRPWFALTAAGRVQAQIFAGLVIEAEGGLALPLVRDQFVFQDPIRVIHEAPAAAGFAGVGLAAVLE